MKRVLIFVAALCLSACAATPPPAVTKGALAAELAYQAAGEAVIAAEKAGVIPASAKPCIILLDARAYGAVTLLREAHDNPASLLTARTAIADLLSRKGC